MNLVTTALRDFWPENGPVWLLSPACLLDPGDSSESTRWTVKGTIRDPWGDQAERNCAYEHIDAIVDKLRVELASRLNRLHSVQRSVRYWEILIGSWLTYFVPVIYDRYHRLLQAQRQLGAFTTIVLDRRMFRTPATTIDFVIAASDDPFNLQIYSDLMMRLGMAGTCTEQAPRPTAANAVIMRGRGWGRRFLYRAYELMYGALNTSLGWRASVVAVKPLLPLYLEIALAARTRGRFWPFHAPSYVASAAMVLRQSVLREELRPDPAGNDGTVERVISEMAADYLPTCFVEDFVTVEHHVDRVYRGMTPRWIMSMGEWHFDEGFKRWAARCHEGGVGLIGGQHGLNYGVLRHLPSRRHEMRVTDRYLTWGWDDEQTTTVPTPASYLIQVRERNDAVRTVGILYCSTAESRYPVTNLYEFERYFERQERFFRALPEDLLPCVTYRPFPESYGRNVSGHVRAMSPHITVEFGRAPLPQRLATARVAVVDNLSTAFAEALICNTPTLLMFDPEEERFLDSARPAIDRLVALHVAHETPETAARWLAEVYDDPAPWWSSAELQDAIREFVHSFARTSSQPMRDWADVIAASGCR